MSNIFYQIPRGDEPYDAIFILIALFSILWYIWLYNKSKRPPGNPPPPGPRGLPIVGNLPFLDPDLHTYFQGLAQKYGPILKLRLGAKVTIVVTSPEVAREITKTHDVTFANRDVPATVLMLTYGGVDIIWSPYGPEWRMLRKVCVQQMLSSATLDSSYGLRRSQTREMIRCLADRARVGSPVNLGEQIFVTLLNIVTQMLWGATVEGQERERIGAEFKQLVAEMVDISSRPNLSDFFPGLSRFDLQGLVKKMRGPALRLDRMFDGLIDQRLRMDGMSQRDGEDFLQFLLKVKDEDETTPLSLNNVKAVLMDLVVAGTDTSSNTIEFAMAELLRKPEIVKRAQEELDEVLGKDKIVEESHITKLPYLLAIMKETLRLHPIAPLLLPRRPNQTTIVAGYTIPKDSSVLINVWAIHRDPNVWENPLEFNPDRFLDQSYDFCGHNYKYFPFGTGRRICAGMAMAERMVLCNLASLLHSFDWKIPEGQSLEIKEKFGIVLKMKNPLLAIPVPRLSDPNLFV